MRIVCRDDAQKRFTVVPGTPTGSPASSATRRARFIPCFSCGKPQPTITSTMSPCGSSGTFSNAARTANAARSSGRASISDPFAARPIGVRAAETMTASGMPRILPDARHARKCWALAERAPAREQLALRLEHVVHVLHELDLRDRILEPTLGEGAHTREQERIGV